MGVLMCTGSAPLPTSLRDAVKDAGILPRPKKQSPDCFLPRLRRGRAFESHYPPHKKYPRRKPRDFYGVDNGIRTHDLQSHNLTR